MLSSLLIIAKIKSYITKNLLFVIFYGIFGILCFAGPVWGYAVLLLVLEKDGVYSEYCKIQSNTVCPEQVNRLNLPYVTAIVMANCGSLPIGLFLDRFGPRKLFALGCFLFGSGFLLFGLSLLFRFDGLIAGFALAGLSSPALLYSIMTTSQFFPKFVATIITFFNCSFDASVFVFSIFKLINDQGIAIGYIFIGYSTMALIQLTGVFFWPKEEIKQYSQVIETSNSNESTDVVQLDEETSEKSPKDTPEISPKLTPKQKCIQALTLMKKAEFPLCLIFGVISMFWMNAHLGTIETQLVIKMGKERGAQLVQIFNGVLPAGVLFTPIIGYLLDRKGMLVSFLIEVICLSIFGLFNVFSIFWLHIVNFIIFTFCRAMLYSALCSYVAKEFGFDNFGTLWGTIQMAAGLMSLLQNAALNATFKYFNGNFKFMNLLQFFTLSSLIYFPLFMWWRKRNKK